MIHQLNSLYPVRYTAFALCVFGLLLSLFALVAFGVGLPVVLVFAALVALGVQGLQLALNGRLAIAHGRQHRNVQPRLLQALAQQLGLALRPNGQGRSGLAPHTGVLGRSLARAHPQNDAVQNRQPKQRRNLHHAPIRQKLRQITPQRLGRGRIGRT